MQCPRCRRELVPQRLAPGIFLRGRINAWFVASGACPHATCGATLFGWSEEPDGVPEELTDTPGFRGWCRRVREPLVSAEQVIPAVAVSVLVAMFLTFAVWALHRMSLVTSDPGSRVAYGIGPLLVALSQLGFVWLVLRDLAADWTHDRRLATSPPGGLRFVPPARSYRA